ncbi:cellulose biosynthesis protein BcsQ [Fontibacillus phaseoli]|uniref:Cellulose biosynthesis protein BcsQ n=1 Tax=Fontibacillus phaseoli TaxID=1416533 RepID=A0A369BFW4_9BACL|nr:ParA family protein [Fontibacillus phaseoli]RCX20433.1 cellulose biosynthesis protein BcsQ [Fontibacillus phaseoli]
MLPVRLVLAVQDEQYIEPFLHYVRCSEFDRRLIITAFSRKDAFLKFLACAEMVDSVLGELSFLESVDAEIQGRVSLICLSEGGRQSGPWRQLSKYQPLHLLLSDLLEILRGTTREGITPLEGRAMLIGVTSTVGGCGKTTLALNVARQLAAEGGKVFYLNLETVQSGIWLEGQEARKEGQRTGLARLLYDLKSAEDRKEPLKFPVSAYAYRHPVLQGDTFGPVDNLNELLEMERKDTAELIDYIACSGLYDTVIIDTDSFPNNRTETVLERSDKLVWLVTDDWDVMRKTGVWLGHLERSNPSMYNTVIGKTLFAANRVSGEVTVSLPKRDMTIEATLSFIPAWSQGSPQSSGLMHSPVYQRDVMKLCRELKPRMNGADEQGSTAR